MDNLIKKLHIFHRLTLLVLVLMLSMSTSLTVCASQTSAAGDSITWHLSEGHLTISGSGEMTDFTDENMAPWYGVAQDIRKVTIGEGVTGVGSLAFYGCSNLGAVSLPSFSAIKSRVLGWEFFSSSLEKTISVGRGDRTSRMTRSVP